MQKNTNEKSKIENASAKTNTATSPIVSVVKNEIHPHSFVGDTVLGVPGNVTNHKTSPINSVVTNEIHPHASVGEGLAPPALSKSKTAGKGFVHPTSSQTDTIITDPNGSYTGTPLNPTEQPVQDVDDL